MQSPLQKFKTLFRARVEIKKNYKVIEFKETAFLKPCIECNTKL